MKKNDIVDYSLDEINGRNGHIIVTKFGIGDTVFFMHNNAVRSGKVNSITTSTCSPHKKTQVSYVVDSDISSFTSDESFLFPTKQDLLNSL